MDETISIRTLVFSQSFPTQIEALAASAFHRYDHLGVDWHIFAF